MEDAQHGHRIIGMVVDNDKWVDEDHSRVHSERRSRWTQVGEIGKSSIDCVKCRKVPRGDLAAGPCG